jgi:hypothetical protein
MGQEKREKKTSERAKNRKKTHKKLFPFSNLINKTFIQLKGRKTLFVMRMWVEWVLRWSESVKKSPFFGTGLNDNDFIRQKNMNGVNGRIC